MTERASGTRSPVSADRVGDKGKASAAADPMSEKGLVLESSTPLIPSDGPSLHPIPLRDAVDASMTLYFKHLDGGDTHDLYAMVMAEVEAPLFSAVMRHTAGNQTRAAEVLGLNRGTLRKKLKQYGLIDSNSG